LCCDIALPAADFDALAVDLVVSVFDALLAAGLLVTFRFLAIVVFLLVQLSIDVSLDIQRQHRWDVCC
jgi:hypothetical protein